jgi:hypothetical protein
MEKIKLVFPEVEYTELDFNGQKLFVKKYSSPADNRLIANYAIQTSEAEVLLGEEESSLYSVEKNSKFEYGFIGGILQVMTNIDIQDINIDIVVSSGLWAKTKSAILNYHDLVNFVEKASNDNNQNLESKLNKIIDNTSNFIENISNMDWSAENIQNMVKELGIGKEKLAEVFPDGVIGTPSAKKEKPNKPAKITP